MNGSPPILAQVEDFSFGDALRGWTAMSGDARYQLAMVGTVILLILALMIWAAFFRKARKRRHRIERPHRWEIEPGADSSRRRHRSHRHKRPGEPTLNPTLAETGGLPPIRPEPPAPPAPPAA